MTIQPNYNIQKGIKPEHRADAARLYAEAFKNKFEKLLGTPDEVTEILKDSKAFICVPHLESNVNCV